MAIKDLLSKFRSISRPSLSRGGTSSTYSSYAKKQLAAEDAILDNQYEAGLLSPEAYLSSLNSRLMRTSNTPLTNVNLQEKIQKTQVKVNDAIVSNKAASGEYTTEDVLGYEQSKLSQMTETGSPAYLAQQQKVQQLTNKAEKEARTAYRTQEMLRISQSPGDSSATLWEKAQVYKTLADQARLDGDVQQADTLETQYNNAVVSAKRADVNDIITGARLSVSGTPTTGLGTPTPEGGESRLSGGSPGQGGGFTADGGPQGASSGSTAPSAVTTGFSGVSNSAVQNALKSLDRQYKSYEKTANAINDDNIMISKYQEAISQAEGDQKTQLTIAYQNLIDSKAQKENSLGIIEQSINDQVVKIQEAQQKAASGAFNQEARKTNQQFDKAESDLEDAFARGEIDKEEYISKGIGLAQMKYSYLSQASDVFNQYGNDSNAESYLEKAAQMEQVHQNLINTATNINNWEPIAADPGGKLTNLFGKQVQPGEVSLVDVTKLKDSGDFDANYTMDNGVYKRIYYPGQQSLVGDGYISKAVAQELSKNATDPNNAPYVYGKGIGPQMAVEKQPLTKGSNGQWLTKDTYQTIRSSANQSLDRVLGKTSETQKLIDNLKEDIKTPTPKAPSLIDRLFQPNYGLDQPKKENIISSAIGNLVGGAKDWLGNAVSGAKNIFSGAKDRFTSAAGNVGLPPLVKKAHATYSDTTDDQIRQWAERAEAETGISADLIIAQYKLESGSGKSAPGNNYFGMKGTGPGGTQRLLTSEQGPNGMYKTYANFRVYNTPEESFIDHARLLSEDPRYANVLAASKTGDKNAIAKAIGNSPYASDSAYGAKIGQIMAALPPSTTPKAPVNTQPIPPVSSGTWLRDTMRGAGGTTVSTSTRMTPQITAPSSYVEPFKPKPANLINNGPGFAPSNVGEAISNAYQNISREVRPIVGPAISKVKEYVAPAIQKVQSYVAPVVNRVQEAAKPVTNFVSNTVNKAKNWLSGLFGR